MQDTKKRRTRPVIEPDLWVWKDPKVGDWAAVERGYGPSSHIALFKITRVSPKMIVVSMYDHYRDTGWARGKGGKCRPATEAEIAAERTRIRERAADDQRQKAEKDAYNAREDVQLVRRIPEHWDHGQWLALGVERLRQIVAIIEA